MPPVEKIPPTAHNGDGRRERRAAPVRSETKPPLSTGMAVFRVPQPTIWRCDVRMQSWIAAQFAKAQSWERTSTGPARRHRTWVGAVAQCCGGLEVSA
jgi:hypothetical protein